MGAAATACTLLFASQALAAPNYDAMSANQRTDQLNEQQLQQQQPNAMNRNDNMGSDSARRWDAFYGHDRFTELTQMHRAPLMNATLRSRDGNEIGTIVNVDRKVSLGITQIAVRTRDGKIDWVSAQNLRFDPQTHNVYTDLSNRELNDASSMHNPRL
jgi:hypothetical protein